MKFEAFLSYWMIHNEAIIQWVLACLVGGGAWLMFRAVFRGERGSASVGPVAGAALDELKTTIQQMMAKMAAAGPITVNAGSGSGSEASAGAEAGKVSGGASSADLENLKKLLAQKEEELKAMKLDPHADKLRSQIDRVQELEAKLKEYEILEDDIADLSLYKEENARLKQEMEKLAASVNSAGSPDAIVQEFASAVQATTDAGAIPMVAPLDGVARAVTPEPVMAAEASTSGEPVSTPPTPEDFSNVIPIDRNSAPVVEAPPAIATPPDVATQSTSVEPVVVPEAPSMIEELPPPATPLAMPNEAPMATADTIPPSTDPPAAENLFAEFSTGSLDTDRVMEELVSLQALQGNETGANTLEESVDPDKMVAEAAGFSKS